MTGNWQEDALRAFAEMYSARTFKEGDQIVFGLTGLCDEMAYAVLNGTADSQILTLCMNATALFEFGLLTKGTQKKENEVRIAGRMLNMNCLQCHVGQFEEQPLKRIMMMFDYMKDTPGQPIVMRRWRVGMLPDSDLSSEERRLLTAAVKSAVDCFAQGHTSDELMEKMQQSGTVLCAQWKKGADRDGGDDVLTAWNSVPLSGGAVLEYVSPELEDELQAHRLRRLPVSGATLSCSLRRLPIPISEEPVRTPIMLAMIDDQNGVVGTDMVENYKEEYSVLAASFMGYVEEFGRPQCVVTDDEMTYGLLKNMAQQINVPVSRAEELPQIDKMIGEYMDSVLTSMLDQMDWTEEESIGEAPARTEKAKNGKGICMGCGSEMTAKEMREHIVGCVQAAQAEPLEDNLILHITDADDADYWMDVALKRDASLRQLDKFLRDVWVDCCDHISTFICGGTEYYSNYAVEMGGRSMNARIFKEMECGTQLRYEYDFAETTRLVIDVIGEVRMGKRHRKALQLARNIQPQYACVKCGAKAEQVASRPLFETIGESAYCAKCAHEKMQREDVQMLPILNSPRCGKCRYGAWLYDFWNE